VVDIKRGEGTTEYGPGVSIDLTGDDALDREQFGACHLKRRNNPFSEPAVEHEPRYQMAAGYPGP
jgi:hypothetical protein